MTSEVSTAAKFLLWTTLFLGSLLIGPWAFCALSALVLTINVLKRSPGPTRRSERARLLDACADQHAAWKRGDDRFAFFGQFPPPQNWEFGYVDGRRAETVAQPPRFWNDGTPMPEWLLVGPAYENAAPVGPGA